MLAQYIRACSPFRSCSLLLQLVPLLQPVPLIQHGETDGRVEEERSGALHVSQPAMDFGFNPLIMLTRGPSRLSYGEAGRRPVPAGFVHFVVRFAVTHAVTGTVTEK